MIEVERKYRISNIQDYVKSIARLDAQELGTTTQKDQVYLPSSVGSFREYTKGTPIIRIRTEDNSITLTLKAGGEAHFTREVETIVSDAKATSQIIEALSMHEVMEIDKTRTTYQCEGFTVALDRVVHLGDFLEVELLVETESEVPDAIKSIDLFAKQKLGLSTESIKNERYDTLLEHTKS